MRGLILILILLVVAAIAAVSTGLINVNQTRPAELPQVGATGNGVVAKGGQAPAFDVSTGKVEIGTGERTVKVPEIRIAPSGNAAAPAPAPAPAQPQAQTTDSTQR
jgi:hypothetical protein